MNRPSPPRDLEPRPPYDPGGPLFPSLFTAPMDRYNLGKLFFGLVAMWSASGFFMMVLLRHRESWQRYSPVAAFSQPEALVSYAFAFLGSFLAFGMIERARRARWRESRS